MSDHKMTSGEVEGDGRPVSQASDEAVASEEMAGTASEAGTGINTQDGRPAKRIRRGFNRQAHTIAGKVAALKKWKEEEGNPKFGRKELLAWYEETYHVPLPKNTFRTWCKNRADIHSAASSIPPDDQEHVTRMMRDGKLGALNKALFHWFESNKYRANLTGPLIKEAAREIFGEFSEAEQMEMKRNTSFNFSDKWLAAWKRRYQISQRKSDGGEAGSAPTDSALEAGAERDALSSQEALRERARLASPGVASHAPRLADSPSSARASPAARPPPSQHAAPRGRRDVAYGAIAPEPSSAPLRATPPPPPTPPRVAVDGRHPKDMSCDEVRRPPRARAPSLPTQIIR